MLKCNVKEISADEIMLEVHGTLMGQDSTLFFQKSLEDAYVKDNITVTLNLTDVDAINSSCIGKIFLFQKKLEVQGRKIRIRGCSDSLHKTFQQIRLEQLISIEK
jgi:anti-anti-sigma factor